MQQHSLNNEIYYTFGKEEGKVIFPCSIIFEILKYPESHGCMKLSNYQLHNLSTELNGILSMLIYSVSRLQRLSAKLRK